MDSKANNSWIKDCEKLIANGDTAEALNLWRKQAPNFKKSQIIQLQNRLNSIQEELDQGVLDNASFRLERNKITNALLRLLNDTTEKPQQKSLLVPIIVGVLLLAMAGFGYQQFVLKGSDTAIEEEDQNLDPANANNDQSAKNEDSEEGLESESSAPGEKEEETTPPPQAKNMILKRWTTDFGNDKNWSVAKHVRTLGDVNGDRRADIIGFYDDKVYVALSNGNGFGNANPWIYDFGSNKWPKSSSVRTMGHVKEKEKAYIIGLKDKEVNVSLSTGGSFSAPKVISNSTEWELVTSAVITGEGISDVIGIKDDGVFWLYTIPTVATNSLDKQPEQLVFNFGSGHGWNESNHDRFFVNVTGDEKSEVVGFGGGNRILVSANKGNKEFSTPIEWIKGSSSTESWDRKKHLRLMDKVNKDKYADLIEIIDDGVYVYLSESDGSGFGPATKWVDAFGWTQGWRNDLHERVLADVNKDGMADMVGFKEDGVYVALSNGEGFELVEEK